MSGDSRTGRSDLGDVESRIRRILSLEGLVPTDWNGTVQPVMIVGDGLLPGYGTSRLRRFSQTFLTAAAGNDRWFTCDQDIIIDRVSCVVNVGATVSIKYQGPNDASPGAINTRDAPMIDRAQTSSELAPVRHATLGVGGGSVIYTSGPAALIVNIVHEIIKTPFLLAGPNVPGADGARLHFESGANVQWMIEARTF